MLDSVTNSGGFEHCITRPSYVRPERKRDNFVEENAKKTQTDKSIHEGDNTQTENANTLAGRTSATLPLCVEKGDYFSDMDSRSRSQSRLRSGEIYVSNASSLTVMSVTDMDSVNEEGHGPKTQTLSRIQGSCACRRHGIPFARAPDYGK